MKGNYICPEDSYLCGGSDKHEPRLGNQGGEIRHRSDSEEYERRIPAVADTRVEDVHHGAFLIDSYLQAFCERDVADYHAESYRHEQKRLPVFFDGNGDECYSYAYHHDVLPCHIGEACVLQELLQAVNNCVHRRKLLDLQLTG